jgi:hypothetical protein
MGILAALRRFLHLRKSPAPELAPPSWKPRPAKVRRPILPDPIVQWRCEERIIETYRKLGRATFNQVRRQLHPERNVGVDVFMRAHRVLVMSGVLKLAGKTQRSEIFKLAKGF